MNPTSGSISYDMAADGMGNYPYGTVASYSCDIGNGLNGVASRICVGDGSSSLGMFDGIEPTCESECTVYRINCHLHDSIIVINKILLVNIEG